MSAILPLPGPTPTRAPRCTARSFRRWTLASLLLASSLTACASHRRSRVARAVPAAANTPPAFPAPVAAPPAARRVGTVRVIGNAGRFVLIEIPGGGASSLPYGQTLRCAATPSADAPATATLRVARERRQPFVVADVVSGEPRVGDCVYATASTDAPAPVVLPTNTSGVLPIVLPDATPPPAARP